MARRRVDVQDDVPPGRRVAHRAQLPTWTPTHCATAADGRDGRPGQPAASVDKPRPPQAERGLSKTNRF
jgi:hypothetical protein